MKPVLYFMIFVKAAFHYVLTEGNTYTSVSVSALIIKYFILSHFCIDKYFSSSLFFLFWKFLSLFHVFYFALKFLKLSKDFSFLIKFKCLIFSLFLLNLPIIYLFIFIAYCIYKCSTNSTFIICKFQTLFIYLFIEILKPVRWLAVMIFEVVLGSSKTMSCISCKIVIADKFYNFRQ